MKKDDRILDEFVEVINRRFGSSLKNIILFGSRARGDHDRDSDYDFLLIFDSVSRERIDTIDEVAGDFLYRYNVVFSAFPVSEENYERERYNPLYMNIRNHGISL